MTTNILQQIEQLSKGKLSKELVAITDKAVEREMIEPVTPTLLNVLVGLVAGRLYAEINGKITSSDVQFTIDQAMDATTKRSAITKLVANPLIYWYTSAVIVLAYFIWKEHHARDADKSSRRRQTETKKKVSKKGTTRSKKRPK